MATTETTLARPVDLEIRITTPWGQGGGPMNFVLNSPSGAVGFSQKAIPGRQIRAPEEYQQKLFRQLEALHTRRDLGGNNLPGAELARELVAIGHDLYQELFPREMRQIYREVRDKVETLVIISDEPWIPWEILRPSEFDDDDFFCMRFQMGRWLAGETALAPGKRIRRLLGLHGEKAADFDKPGSEIGLLRQFFHDIPGLECTFPPSTNPERVVNFLEQDALDLLHFAGHGGHDPKNPRDAGILLGEQEFRVRHLSPQAERRLREQRPMVFFNACHVGRVGRSLTRLDGWAARWVQRCGCSAFLAPLWSVPGPAALRFSQAFYHHLAAGSTLGEAVLFARHTLRKEMPDTTAWLAYSFYGHPNARILFGDHRQTGVAPAPPTEWKTLPELPPIGRTPERPPILSPRQRSHALIVLGILAVAILLALLYFNGGSGSPESPGLDGGETVPPAGKSSETRDEVQARTPPPPDSIKEPIEKVPKASIPLQALVHGKVGILALDSRTKQPVPQVAQAIEAVLREGPGNLNPVVPWTDDVSDTELQRLATGDLSFLPKEGGTPWGAEYLLAALVTQKDLPDSSPHLVSVNLTLGSRLITTKTGTLQASSTSSQTGRGASMEVALKQAAERCLGEILESLEKGV